MTEQANISNIAKFEFITNEFKLALTGYPIWEASIVAAKSDYWVKVIPKVDINKKIIYRPTPRKLSTSTDKYILTVSDLKTIYQPHYNELIDDFFNSIPKDISSLVSKFKDSHWECVKAIILIGEDLISLMKTNPALAYIVVNMDKINKSFICYTNVEILQRMIRTKHKEILKLAGFTEAERMVKIFAKMDIHSVTVEEILKLKNVLAVNNEATEETLKLLSFAKSINKKLIVLIAENYMLLSKMTHKVIFDIVISERYEKYLRALSEIIYYGKILNIQIPILSSLTAINNLNVRFRNEFIAREDKKELERMNLQQKMELKKKPKKNRLFYEQPYENNCFVQAICSEYELNEWAGRQRNCISARIKDILKGRSYFYKVIYKNEEATLELKISNEKIRWGDLLGRENHKVSAELKEVVDEWLKGNRITNKAN